MPPDLIFHGIIFLKNQFGILCCFFRAKNKAGEVRHEARIDSRGKVKVGPIIPDIVPNILKAVILLIRRPLHPPPSNIMSGALVSPPPTPRWTRCRI